MRQKRKASAMLPGGDSREGSSGQADGAVNVVICDKCWEGAGDVVVGAEGKCFCLKCGETKAQSPSKRFMSIKEEAAQFAYHGNHNMALANASLSLPGAVVAGPSSAAVSWADNLPFVPLAEASNPRQSPAQPEAEEAAAPPGVCASVHSLLHISQGKPQKKYDVTWAEINRRSVSPERLSPYCVNSYLRNSKTALAVVRAELQDKGLPINSRSGVVTTLTKLCEGEVKDLVEDMQFLIAQYVPRKLIVSTHAQDLHGDGTVVRLSQLQSTVTMLDEYSYIIQQRGSRFNQVTHGLGPGMFKAFIKLLKTLAEEEIEHLSSN
ncbi:uncharacterized protein LOC133343538 isoform X1 [Lethenteron reissneri]|uniref:uncharacterized protein LOC133343538 isoform X1 n=1 Tax=Lethenteron reissneri TaxID=7753 RepID=UPI002AB73D59|nr:uncharacterized protein LOC133343538 isoform X1 [Lethenteron reissneri]XP_061409198.1 uncharacterized protein LOC133343538 isoform X1 [Lethenteron reissneri]XP_061409199.1 uncharacterized protein LOC133343538 isoform X1 [Lethenteron reissneri]